LAYKFDLIALNLLMIYLVIYTYFIYAIVLILHVHLNSV
jgi:hypothetical protein